MDIERAFKWTRRKLFKTEQGRDMDWTRTRRGQDKDRQGQDKEPTRTGQGQIIDRKQQGPIKGTQRIWIGEGNN